MLRIVELILDHLILRLDLNILLWSRIVNFELTEAEALETIQCIILWRLFGSVGVAADEPWS